MCRLIPGILRRLDALEKQIQPMVNDPELEELDKRDAQLDEFEAQLDSVDEVNNKKLDDLKNVSEQVVKIKEEINALQAKTAPTAEQEQMLAENQKILETYAATWQMTNQIFMKMYNQLAPVFKLPEVKPTNTAMFEGIQNLGQGLLQMAQIIAITRQHNSAAQHEAAEEDKNAESQ